MVIGESGIIKADKYAAIGVICWPRLDLRFNLRTCNFVRVRYRAFVARWFSILEGWNTGPDGNRDNEEYLIGRPLTCRSYKCLNCSQPEVDMPAVWKRGPGHADYKNIRFAGRPAERPSYVRRPLRPGLSRSHNYLLSGPLCPAPLTNQFVLLSIFSVAGSGVRVGGLDDAVRDNTC